MKTKILSLLIIAALFISTGVYAQQPNRKQVYKQNAEQKAMMTKRNSSQRSNYQKFFTEEQQEAMKTLRLETANNVKPFKNQLRELMAHQQTLTTANNADLKAINKNIDKMSGVKTEIAKIMAAQQQQIRSLLTEEQLLRFDSQKNNRSKGNKGNSTRPRQRMGA
ncbi:MAG: Spy/CpxP family protein refolding chaperone [Draconibacterium sp.]|nr:Spy/CpxP family protein refolding chaperone [Draconibacterium sp.]